jgi:hypothetical protein
VIIHHIDAARFPKKVLIEATRVVTPLERHKKVTDAFGCHTFVHLREIAATVHSIALRELQVTVTVIPRTI